MEIFYDILSIFIGFILGIFFEKWTENNRGKEWARLALLSVLDDLVRDHRIFKPVLEMDRNRIDEDKALVSKINESSTLQEMYKLFDQIFINSEENQIWSNVTNDESNYIDLNRANYDSFVKNANRDDLLDNQLKGNLDWLFEGLIEIYRSNRKILLKAEYDLKIKCTEAGYPCNLSDDKNILLENSIKNQILSYFEIYFEMREKDLLIKKKIIGAFEWNIKRTKKNLEKPIISDVYKKDYEIPSIEEV